MKVRAIEDYFDITLNRNVVAGEEFTVNETRGKVLTTDNNSVKRPVCEVVSTPTTEKVGKGGKKKQEA